MAKARAPSKHSRAARRATSPGINTDKSLKHIPRPRSSADDRTSSADLRPSILAVQQAAGVQKKKLKPIRKSRMSTRARRRHERGLEVAEAVSERTSAKVRRSMGRARVVEERRRTWEDVNRRAMDASAAASAATAGNAFGALAEEEDDDDEEDAVDAGAEADEDMGAGDVVAVPFGALALNGSTPAAAAAVAADDDGDEIL